MLSDMSVSELSKLVPWSKYPSNELVFFDLETTGFGDKDLITEVGAVRLRRGASDFERFSVLFQVHKPVPQEVVDITGITDQLLKEHGKPFYVAFAEFKDFVGDSDLFAYNVRFDRKFVTSFCKKYNITFSNYMGDSMLVCRKAFKLSGTKLKDVAEHLGLDYEGAHRADFDSEVGLKCFIAALHELEKNSAT